MTGTKTASPQPQLIDILNEILAEEWRSYIQYTQHSIMMSGIGGSALAELFAEIADVESDHAKEIASRIDFLGGQPTTILGDIEPWQDGWTVEDAARVESLAEDGAIALYEEALALAKELGDVATARICEDHVLEEEDHLYQFLTILGESYTVY